MCQSKGINVGQGYWWYWGKCVTAFPPKQKHYPGWHLFHFHCLDVAAVAACWWEGSLALRKAFAHSMGCDENKGKAWVLFFIALHDYGKLDVRFQRKSEARAQCAG